MLLQQVFTKMGLTDLSIKVPPSLKLDTDSNVCSALYWLIKNGHAKVIMYLFYEHNEFTVREIIIKNISSFSKFSEVYKQNEVIQVLQYISQHPTIPISASAPPARASLPVMSCLSDDMRKCSMLKSEPGLEKNKIICGASFTSQAPGHGKEDHRPLVLTECGHTFCTDCITNLFIEKKPCCPECQSPIQTPLEKIPINWILIRFLKNSERNNMEKRQAIIKQDEDFRNEYPYMASRPLIPDSRAIGYDCLVCKLFLGPIHRALEHITVPQLVEKHSQFIKPKNTSASAGLFSHAAASHSEASSSSAHAYIGAPNSP